MHAVLPRQSLPAVQGEIVCEECARLGAGWVRLQRCTSCGHVGCCEHSPHQHARRHFEATGHALVESVASPRPAP